MPRSEEWIEIARSYNGQLFAWINQSAAPKIIAGYSKGVCFALTRHWLESFSGDVSERMKFVTSLRKVNSERKFDDYCVPDEYYLKQAQYMDTYKSRQYRLNQLKIKFNDYRKQNPGEISQPFIDAMIETFALHVKFFIGDDCLEYTKIDGDLFFPDDTTFENAFLGVKENQSFYMVSFQRGKQARDLGESGNAHVVGFGFCPKSKAGSASYYFDANLGLFYFGGDADNVFKFFCQAVKLFCEYDQKYSIVEIRKFGTRSHGSRALVCKAAKDELES